MAGAALEVGSAEAQALDQIQGLVADLKLEEVLENAKAIIGGKVLRRACQTLGDLARDGVLTARRPAVRQNPAEHPGQRRASGRRNARGLQDSAGW